LKTIDGRPVHNAAMPVRLNVTAADIKDGAPLNPYACAIALAAVRQVKGATAAKVHLSCCYIMVNGEWRRYRMQEHTTREVVAYDRGGKFIPGEYDLMPVSAAELVRRVDRIRGGKPKAATKSRRMPRRHYTEGVRDPAYKSEPK
jgi:hypothetical protein